jgi:hypothetical protein
LGIFLYFDTGFWVITKVMRVFWYFHVDFFIFNKKKLLVRIEYALMSGWRLCHQGNACKTTWWLNLTFRCFFGCAIKSSFTWGDTWWRGGQIVTDDHFFPFFSLFCQVKCMVVFFFFSISILILLVSYFVLIHFIEVLVFFISI